MSDMGGSTFAGGDSVGGDFSADDVSASDFGEAPAGGDLGWESGGSDFADPVAEASVAGDAGAWGEDDSAVEVPDYSGIGAPDDAPIDSSIVTAQADQAPFVEQPIPSDVTQIPDGTLTPVFNDNADDTRRIDQFQENADDITRVPDDGGSGDGRENPSLDYTPPGPGGLG